MNHPTAMPLTSAPASVTIVTGPVVNEAQHTYSYVTQSTRLWVGAGSVEVEWTVGPVNVSDYNGHEVITRYSSGLATDGAWTTDSNCRENQKRQRDFRPQWKLNASEPVSSNYYPVNCLSKFPRCCTPHDAPTTWVTQQNMPYPTSSQNKLFQCHACGCCGPF